MRSRHRRLSFSLASLRGPIHYAAALALVLTLGWLPAGLAASSPAARQTDDFPGVDGGSYESPSWGYTLEWDEDLWAVRGARSANNNDRLLLSRAEGDGLLYVDGYDSFSIDPVSCIAGGLAKLENRTAVADIAPYENPDGAVVAGEEDDRAFVAYRFTVERQGATEEQVQYNECRTIVPGEAVVEITHITLADVYEEEAALVADVLATLTIPAAEADEEATEEPAATPEGATPGAATPEASPDGRAETAETVTPTAEATEDAEDELTVEVEATIEVETEDDAATQAATEAPTEEATEEATDEATDDADERNATEEPDEEATEAPDEDATEEPEDDEATEEATEDAEVERPSEEDLEDAGVDDDTYTSPTFDYTLEWDEDDWEVVNATSEDDIDTLVLTSDASTLTVVGLEDFDGDPADCLDELIEDLEDGPDVEEFEPALDRDGDPIEIDEDDRVGAVYAATVDGEEFLYRVECRILVEDEAVIQIVQAVPADDFNDEIGLVSDVLDTLTLDDEEPADDDDADDEDIDEIPIPDDEDDEQDQDEDDAADDDAADGVDGNAYTSPTFGYTFEWDEDDWTVDAESTRSVPGDDFLALDGRRGGLTIWGLEDFGGDPLVCFSTFVDILAEDNAAFTVEEVEPFENEDGDVIEGDEDDRVFGAFRFTLADGDDEFELVYYVECRTLVEGEAVLVIIHGMEPLAYESEAARREDVLDTLELPGGAAEDEDEEDADEEDEDTGDDEDNEEEDEDEDEQTPDGGGRSPDEDEDQDQEDDRNLQTYTSDRFGYTVAWDRDLWSLTQRDVEDDRDFIAIDGEAGDLSFAGQARFGGDPDDCLNTAITNLRAIDGVEDWRRIDDTSLLPEGRGGRDSAAAMFSFTLAPEGRTPVEYYAYVDCRVVVPGESVLAIVYTVPAADYEAERDALGAVLTAIDLPGD